MGTLPHPQVRPVSDVRLAGPRLFATAADEPRARRVTDGITLAAAVLALGTLSVAASPPPGFSVALETFLLSLPTFLRGGWQIVVDLLIVLAVAVVVGAAVRRRWTLVRDLVLAPVAAFAVWLLVERLVEGSWPAIGDALTTAGPPPWYPSPKIAVPASVILVASPHLARPARRLGRWIIGLSLVAACALGATSPMGAVAGLLVATLAAALVHLVFGSCAGRPSLHDVRGALAQLGVEARDLGAADRQPAGLFLVRAVAADGEPIEIKVYGRDAHDSALLNTVWRTVWFRGDGSPIRFGRVQQVEHEAFLTLLARQAGVRTDTVITAGSTAEDDALLVLRRHGRPIVELDEAERPPPEAIWGLVGQLHRAGIAHGQLDERHLVVDDGELGVVGFRGATVAASDARRGTDQAQAFATTLLQAGEDRASEAALDALGTDGFDALLTYLQPAALTVHQREAIKAAGIDLDEVREHAASRAGAEAPPLQQLRRITVGSLVRVVLPAIAIVALISGIAGLDLEALGDTLAEVSWWLMLVAFLLTQVPRLTQSIATLGASPVPLPLGPVYGLQLAVSYVNLAIPSTAARVAVNIRFFQRHGVPPGTAIAAGALDGFTGFVVQASLLLGLLLLTPASLDVDLSGSTSGAARVLLLVLALAVVAVVVVAVVPPWRRFVLRWARKLGGEALSAVRGLKSPRRVAMLLGGNIATELLFAFALAMFVEAYGFSINFADALIVNIGVALLAGLLPIPGGIGVAEGALTYGLIRAGLPEEVAFGVAISYRMSSFYLPPIWGYFAFRWLERNQHL